MVTRADDPCSPPTGVLRYMGDQIQQLLPREWRMAFHHRKAQSVREILCVLYVAITRARNALYMVLSPRGANTQRGTQTCESLLQSVLGQPDQYKTPECVLYEQGSPNWYQSLSADSDTLTSVDETSALDPNAVVETPQVATPLQVIRLDARPETAPLRGMKVTAPSTMAEQTSVRLDRLFTATESVGAAIGTLIHSCFEQIDWIEDFDIQSDPRISTARLRELALQRLTRNNCGTSRWRRN